MGFQSVLGMAHKWAAERIRPGDMVIDATLGNGVDTLFLAEQVGRGGTVYGFDVQPAALARTQQRLQSHGEERLPKLELHLESHERMLAVIPRELAGSAAAVMFNLGYLPGGDETIPVITEPASTLSALQAAMKLLKPGGILTVVLYPGHQGGKEEAEAVLAWAAGLLLSDGQAVLYQMVQKPQAPLLLGVEKK